MFPPYDFKDRTVEPNMEAAGIEPAQDSPGCGCSDGIYAERVPVLMSVRCPLHRGVPVKPDHYLAYLQDDGTARFAREVDRVRAREIVRGG